MSISFSEELAGLHETMTKLLKLKDSLQRALGSKYGESVAPLLHDCLAEVF